MGSLRSVGRDPLGVMEGIPKGSQERSLGDESGLKREEGRVYRKAFRWRSCENVKELRVSPVRYKTPYPLPRSTR